VFLPPASEAKVSPIGAGSGGAQEFGDPRQAYSP
jgi:hypothetical protein